jgi:flagellar motor switch protein FliN/FliY
MSEAVVYEQLDQEAQPAPTGVPPAPTGVPPTPEGTEGVGVSSSAGPQTGADLRRLSDVPVELSVEIGRTRMTVGETLQLRAGSIVTLERLAGEPVDLLVNGTPIARGEVVVVDEQFGLRVTEIVEGEPAARDHGEQPLADAGEPAQPNPVQANPAQGDPAVQE